MPKITISVDETTKQQLDEISKALKAKGIVSSKSEFVRSLVNWIWTKKMNDNDLWKEIITSRIPD